MLQKKVRMEKKITRTVAEKKLRDLVEEMEIEILESDCLPVPKYYTGKTYIENGKNIIEYYCQKCGYAHKKTVNTKTRNRYPYFAKESCPKCGNNSYCENGILYNEKIGLYVKETEDGFIYVVLTTRYHFSRQEDWQKTEPKTSIRVNYIGMFDQVNGYFTLKTDGYSYRLLTRGSKDDKYALEKLAKLTPINTISSSWNDLLQEMTDWKVNMETEKNKKKAKSKASVLEEMRRKYKAKQIDEQKLLDQNHTVLYEMCSNKDGVEVLSGYCTKCKREFQFAQPNHICLHCGTDTLYPCYGNYNQKVNSHIVVYEDTNLPEQDLLIRVFAIERQYSIAEGYKELCFEQQRIFAGKKVTVYTRPTHETIEFKKDTINSISSGMYTSSSRWCNTSKFSIIQNDDEIREIIKNSCLKYSGLIEAYGLGDKRYHSFKEMPDISYLMAWYKNPSIELILKANLSCLLDNYVNNMSLLNKGNNLAEIMAVEPAVVRMVTKDKPMIHFRMLTDLNALYIVDNSITIEVFDEIVHNNIAVRILTELKQEYNIDFSKSLKYLQTVYDHQCIEKPNALNIWADYLRMAKLLKFDLKDKSRLYPSSLKKEHDVATFAYRSVQVELDKEKFAQQAERNAYYEYTYKDLMVIVPKTPEEVVEEATRQRNCLRSYVERIKNGKTVVAFIRRKDSPNESYITVEVLNGTLNQLKGYCNSNPRNKEVDEFVNHWAKVKGIHVYEQLIR